MLFTQDCSSIRRLAAVVATIAALAGLGFGGGAVHPSSATAKSCSAGYTRAVINGSEKCLRRGQFCARAADRQYQRYGFRCRTRDARGNYRLT